MSDYFLSINKTKFDKFGSLSWSDDFDTYTTIIKFSSQKPFDVGQQFILNNGTEKLYRGIITDFEYDRELIYHYTAYDFGFYLGKNEITHQFKNIDIETGIRTLLLSLKIPIGTIEGVRGTVDKPYKKATVKDVISDLLSLASGQTGIKYVVDCSLGQVNIRPVYKLDDIRGELSKDFYINSAENLGNAKITNSIQDLKNRIRIYDGDTFDLISEKFDSNSIGRYGLLQEIVDPDKNAKNYSVIAQNTLLERNRIKTTLEVDLLGDDRIKKGTIISIKDTVVNIVGDYLVQTSQHSVEKGVHSVHCKLELYQ